jgi:hypothetical protein
MTAGKLLALGLITATSVGFGIYRLQWLRRLRRSGFSVNMIPPVMHPSHLFLGSEVSTIRCGLRINRFTVMFPLGSLTFDDEFIRLDAVIAIAHMKDSPRSIWLPRSDLVRTRVAVRRIFMSGIAFETIGGRYSGILVWHPRPKRVISALATRGWHAIEESPNSYE